MIPSSSQFVLHTKWVASILWRSTIETILGCETVSSGKDRTASIFMVKPSKKNESYFNGLLHLEDGSTVNLKIVTTSG